MRKLALTRIVFAALILVILAPFNPALARPPSQEDESRQLALQLLDRLTPEERVGQLFLITFNGPEVGPSTQNQMYDLIINRHIGGVVLSSKNDNFIAADQTLPVLISLVSQIQRAEYIGSQQSQRDPGSGEDFRPAFVPLFIGISQEGDGPPYDEILSGLTPLPSQMAIGATWNPELAQNVGTVLGNELSTLGINLLIGPSLDVLDVLESPFSEGTGDLGVRSFGGDPFWVGEMGRSFITGLHQGSNGEIAVVPKHFPGYGSSDRLPEEEVATVRKSLEQLKQIELSPFFAVTGNAPTVEATADGLLTSHIRYQGLQGNIRDIRKPISFDAQAFTQLMALPAFASWRDNGGVMISADLGSRAIRRFYDPTGQTFNSRTVALDAFKAGNDLLYLGDFTANGDPDLYTTIFQTLDTFTRKYREDPAFAQRVDESVLRILSLKYRLFKNTFSLNQSLPPQTIPATIGRSDRVTFDVARQAATLISPSLVDPNGALPDPPGRNDEIIILTDSRLYQQCSKCPLQRALQVDALEKVIIRLYSAQAGGQVLPGNLSSYTFDDLQELLSTGSGIMEFENKIRQAEWIVFLMLNVNQNVPSSLALRRFLDQRPDLYQQKQLVVFALNTPYYLDATDISKLTAYYGLYSKTPAFVDVAARLLFQELSLDGDLPVSIPGVYDLNSATFPNPEQTIQLLMDLPVPVDPSGTITPEPPVIPQYKIGDVIPVRTGIIVDHNGNPVPDKTIVRFITNRVEGGISQLVETEAETTRGVAHSSIRVDGPGLLQIRVESEPARQSDTLSFDIAPENGVVIEPSATPTLTITPTQVPTATITPTQVVVIEAQPPRSHTLVADWLMALIVTLASGVSAYWFATIMGQVRWGVRGGFLTLIGGLVAYTYLAAQLPGSANLVQKAGSWGIFLVILLGSLLGWGISWGWRAYQGTRKA